MKAITVENLSKVYSVATANSEGMSFREMLIDQARSLFKKSQKQEEFYALKDVSFEVEQGEVLGIIGKNGSGKSTLLKILSKITAPTSGRAIVRGRVASLLEVGTGFHAELSGRENIFMSGIILGMKRWEINQYFDEIVSFAGVEQFLDMPVKKYSSGMRLRLAFSVAAHLQPEILLVDEVLAVGDYEFEKKCLKTMEGISNAGRTILFVSHNMDTVSRLCNKIIALNKGIIVRMGPSCEVIDYYLGIDKSKKGFSEFNKDILNNSYIELLNVSIENKDFKNLGYIYNNEAVEIQVSYKIKTPYSRISLFLVFYNEEGDLLFATSEIVTEKIAGKFREVGAYRNVCIIPAYIFKEENISVSITVGNAGNQACLLESNLLIRVEKIISFFVKDHNKKKLDFIWKDYGLVKPAVKWIINKL